MGLVLVRQQSDPRAPRCPDCGAVHYPATLGSGARVWCNGSPVEPRSEILAGLRSAAFRIARIRSRREHVARMANGSPTIDPSRDGI